MTDVIRSDEVQPEKVTWLWRDRIPFGMLAVVAGRPDQGKGLFAAHVAAHASLKGINVLYSASEDSRSLMTRPRLEAAGARLERVHLWRFQLPRHMDQLEQIVVEKKIGLIVIDPLASHLSGNVSRHSDNIRTVLDPLTSLIESVNASCLIIEHALKRVPHHAHPLSVIGGSGSGLTAACRVAYVFGVDPKDGDKRILVPAKCNVRDLPQAVSFELDTVELDKVGEQPALLYEKELGSFNAMSLFDRHNGVRGRPPDKMAAAAEWLTQYLDAAGKPVRASKVLEDAKQYVMSLKTLRRAADQIQVVKNPTTGGPKCTWDLPDELKEVLHPDVEDVPASDVVRADELEVDWDAEMRKLKGDTTDE